MERSTRLRTPDKYNTRSVFSSTQMDNKTRTPIKTYSGEPIPERFNYSIETKKKATIIEKIAHLAPFLESLIGKSEVRSVQILDRLVELRNELDDIFEDISGEFEAAQSENNDLRKSLETIPRQRAQAQASAENERLQRLVDQLQSTNSDLQSKIRELSARQFPPGVPPE